MRRSLSAATISYFVFLMIHLWIEHLRVIKYRFILQFSQCILYNNYTPLPNFIRVSWLQSIITKEFDLKRLPVLSHPPNPPQPTPPHQQALSSPPTTAPPTNRPPTTYLPIHRLLTQPTRFYFKELITEKYSFYRKQARPLNYASVYYLFHE